MTQEQSSKSEAGRRLNVAMVGNPNTGKTSLFNRLTGLRQHVGNYPGVTVERKTGQAVIGGLELNIIDLPGTYSLAASSPDEAVVSEALLGRLKGEERPDFVICVVDSTAPNTLFLALQVADIGLPMLIALNMRDEAAERGIVVNAGMLRERLGVPCVAVSARTGEGVDELRHAIAEVAREGGKMKQVEWPMPVIKATEAIREHIGQGDFSDAELHRVLFDASGSMAHVLGIPESDRKQAVDAARKILFASGINPMTCEAMVLHKAMRRILDGVTNEAAGYAGYGFMRFRRGMGRGRHRHGGPGGGCGSGRRGERSGFERMHAHSNMIDRILLHRGWGLLIFAGIMYAMFQAVYSWSAPFMDAIDWLTQKAQDIVSGMLFGHEMLRSLVVDGVIGGVGACFSFLPQILILFMFIAILEDTGYLPRAAFLMDKIFSWCGLSGQSFVPMLSSYACAVPGVMAARTIRDPKARIVTILVSPLMSCSARLPIYVLFIGLTIEPRYGPFYAGLALFAMHFVGLLIAGPVAYILTHYVMRTPQQPFLLALPPYRMPRVSDVAMRMYERGKLFVYKAGTLIFAMTVIVWALLYFPRPDSIRNQAEASFPARYAEANGMLLSDVNMALAEGDQEVVEARARAVDAAFVGQSYLGRFGRFIQPVFAPAGFDWKLTVAVVSSIPAREVVLSTLGTIYSLGSDVDEEEDALRERMHAEVWPDGPMAGQPVYSVALAFSVMFFFALCQQCMATLAVIAREAGFRWAVFSFTYMTALAWVFSVLVYQIVMRV